MERRGFPVNWAKKKIVKFMRNGDVRNGDVRSELAVIHEKWVVRSELAVTIKTIPVNSTIVPARHVSINGVFERGCFKKAI